MQARTTGQASTGLSFFRNVFGTRCHAVWPTPNVPSTLYWTEADWVAHEDLNRPADYTGGRHDQEAWEAYAAIKDAERAAELRARILAG